MIQGRPLLERLTRGTPCMLLALLLLFSRIVASSFALAQAADAMPFTLGTICHSDPSGEPPGKNDHPDHRDCLLCPACHMLSHASVPVPSTPVVPSPSATAIGIAAPFPPATGPPHRVQTSAKPTGPPSLSV